MSGFPSQSRKLKMNPSRLYIFLFITLLVLCFSVAAKLEPQFQAWRGSRADGDMFKITLGDSRALFANQFYVKADEYYHSGYYPTIFDNRQNFETPHLAADTGAVSSKNKGEEESFRHAPRDWIDAFGRHFYPDRHTHLDEGGPADDLSSSSEVREILPWLKLSADLDPDNVQTYVVTAYWLRLRMHKNAEAEAFLREGLRHNPDSYEILYELGRLYDESYHDIPRARNVWELAVQKWSKLDPETMKENRVIFEQITGHLAQLEYDQSNWPQALHWFQATQKASLTPGALQERIDEIQQKISTSTNNAAH
jgi:tetratricopeptide (TPR) repeat protein